MNNSVSNRWGHTLRCLLVAAALHFTALAWTSLAWAGGTPIAVIYPDIGEPYREIFKNIIGGIEEKIGTPVINYAVHSNTDIDALRSSLQQQNIQVVIALGRQGMLTAALLDGSLDVVVGGVLTIPKSELRDQAVISLIPDPALLFARLKELMPAAKRVWVVYDPNISGWLIKLATEAARVQGLELVAYQAQDLRSAVKFYQDIFATADNRRDALWLPQDASTVEDTSILPLVLQSSWNKNIAVFSSNSAHVRRGVLFSLYPDNAALGKSLAGLAQNFLTAGNLHRGMLPLRDVQFAVNLRTAKHIGLDVSSQQNFDMTFPEK